MPRTVTSDERRMNHTVSTGIVTFTLENQHGRCFQAAKHPDFKPFLKT